MVHTNYCSVYGCKSSSKNNRNLKHRFPRDASDVSSDMQLVDYLRTRLQLRGTKYMCREGGCGACIVSAATAPGEKPRAVNSCLVSVTSCQGWEITTIEKVGNKLQGYHPIQETLAKENGTQCGYCSPGWVMSLYSLLQSDKKLTMLDIEKSFGSNLCRCTGYRPILKAFKTFASDAPKPLTIDIEDLNICEKTNKICDKTCSDEDWCVISENSITQESVIKVNLSDGKKWYKVYITSDIFDILKEEGDDYYMLVAGNTAKGVVPIDEYPRILIDITGVTELKGHDVDQNLVIGACTTLSEVLNIFEIIGKTENFAYLEKMHDHLLSVAHIPVRNLGTIAGNLMTKHKYRKFPSDIFLLLETVGAFLTILESKFSKKKVSMQEFLDTDMKGKVLYDVLLPPLNDIKCKLVTFKIMPRSQSAHAMVNAGFLLKLENNKVLESRLVFGGLSAEFIRASQTETYLQGKDLFDNNTLQDALKTLEKEIIVKENAPEPSPEYRKQLALALLYKGLLTLCPEDQIGNRYRSGIQKIHDTRPVSQARQEFTTDPKLYPLNEPLPKIDGLIQCAGEAKYTDDLPSFQDEVFSALVLSTVAQGDIDSIDASEALKMPGVVAFFSAKDIPGKNTFIMFGVVVFVDDEEVFCADKVKYYNQPIGMIVANSTAIAERATKLVKVTYKNVKPPVLDIKVAKNDTTRTKLFFIIPNIGKGMFVKKEFKNNYTIRGQYHLPMETIMCVTVPSEHGIKVYSTTQWMDSVQYVVSKALNIDENRVDVYVNRLGGAFGLKVTRSSLAAVACSLAAYKLNRPCRLIQSMPSTTRALGKRFPCSTDVEVGVDSKGLVQYLNYNLYEDNGWNVSELITMLGLDAHNNVYKRLWWNYKCYNTTTDNAKNSWCRSPGSVEHIAMSETVMEQISYELSLDPYEVRMTNLDLILHHDIKELAEDLKKKAQYSERRASVNTFNAENRWKKRGLRWAFMKYAPLSPAGFEVNMSVCHGDGSVIISHGGIEMGQGVNTKAIQIAAHFLNIPVDKIKVKGSNTITGPNSMISGSSITSQSIGMGVEKCCKDLISRLAPIKIMLLNPLWETLIKTAHSLKIDLQVHTFVNDLLSPIFFVYGVVLAEVEVDILTGESEILRVDLLEDVGQSVSPQIDVGQIEGAFIMGLGYWTSEKLVYDQSTGELLSDRTWDYVVPQARDIPQDFRVYFREKSYSAPVVLGAKVTGEPATCLAIAVPFAMREAVSSARGESRTTLPPWFNIDGPSTTEQLFLAAGTTIEDFKYK